MKVDLLVKNVKVFNSYLKKFKDGNVAILNNKFLYIDNNKNIEFEASSTIDGKNQYMIPGFIDIHMHIESSMMTPAPFCHHLSKNGVTTIVAEPHEIANVFGKKGIEAMIAAENSINTSIFYGIPSSVPSTSPDLETTGAILDFEEMKNLTSNPKVICIGEIMNYRKVIVDNSLDICKFIEYIKKNKPQYAIEGHCPKLLDLDLAKFLYLGINGDHTEHTFEEFVQRFENGMFMELQAKSISSELINYIKENNLYEHFAFVTDDTMPDTFLHKGHLNVVIKKAIQAGINIENAIYCATFTPARRMNLHDRGVIAPGKKADFLLIDNLKNLHITQTFIDGKEVYNINSEAKYIPTDYKFPEEFYQSVRVEKINEDNKSLLESLKEALKDKVVDVKVSNRLKSHPVCLVSDQGVSFEMEKVLNAMPDGQDVKAGRILEINPNHDIFKAIQNVYQNNADKINDYASLLFDQALLIEGLSIEDPVAFSNKICELMIELNK